MSILRQSWIDQNNQPISSNSFTNSSENIALSLTNSLTAKKEDKLYSKICIRKRRWIFGIIIGSLLLAIALAAGLTVVVKDKLRTITVLSSAMPAKINLTTTSNVCVNGNTAITFDDRPSATSVPNGYKNINWTNAVSYTVPANTSGYYTGIVSKNMTSYNPFGNPMTMKTANGSRFNLYSAAVAAAWCNGLQLKVTGYNSNVTIISRTYTLQIYSVAFITFVGFSSLDTVTFSTSNGTSTSGSSCSARQYAMDNICLSFI